MNYFNPKVYNKQNLNESDRAVLEYWEDEFTGVIRTAKEHFERHFSTGSETLDKIRKEIVENFSKKLMVSLGYMLQENVVGIIDHYDREVDEVEDFETFLYDEDEEGE